MNAPQAKGLRIMESILQSATPDHYNARRHLKCSDHRPIPPKYHKVLSLHLAGRRVQEICSETGYKDSTVYAILADQRVVQIRQQLLKSVEQEFEALYPRVVETLRDDLTSGISDQQAKARDQWFRASGKYKESGDKSIINVTAEDVVFQILNQGPGGQDAS